MRIPLLVAGNLERVKEGPVCRLDKGRWVIRSSMPDIPVRVKLSSDPAALHSLPHEFEIDCSCHAQVFILMPVKAEVSIYAEMIIQCPA